MGTPRQLGQGPSWGGPRPAPPRLDSSGFGPRRRAGTGQPAGTAASPEGPSARPKEALQVQSPSGPRAHRSLPGNSALARSRA